MVRTPTGCNKSTENYNTLSSNKIQFVLNPTVLPSFEVKLTSETKFFYVDSPELAINIRAT